MRRKADEEGRDLLVIDTGDRIEGNGLYDASDPKGKYTFDIFKHQDIDVICSGNHELYKQNSSQNEYDTTVPLFRGRYLASNLDIRDAKTGDLQPLAQRFRKFKTKNLGLRITAFGFLYNFQGYANNTFVRPVEDAIKEAWFQEAIRDRDTDLFLVAGHVAADSEEYQAIFKAIRDVQWDIPIQFFAGHTHVRDFRKYDKLASAIESGRYMETIGFLSLDGIKVSKQELGTTRANLKVNRRYIDNNLYSMHHHTSLNLSTFATDLGRNVSKQITDARNEMRLDHRHGCAPRDLWIDRVGIEDDSSIFKWLRNQVLPDQFSSRKDSTKPKLVLTNTGAMRFDVFEGPFTVDSTYLVSPFTSSFRYIKNVDIRVGRKLLSVLNNNGEYLMDADPSLDPSLLLPPQQLALSRIPTLSQSQYALNHATEQQHVLGGDTDLTPGYITKDDDGTDGDDTIHSRVPFFRVPNCIQSEVDFPEDTAAVEKVDVVYNEFIEPWMILAFRFLGIEYDEEDTASFFHGEAMTDIIADWVENNWPCEE